MKSIRWHFIIIQSRLKSKLCVSSCYNMLHTSNVISSFDNLLLIIL
nr:MAG TPA: hypothetical protein [Caudoviricetes sp.]